MGAFTSARFDRHASDEGVPRKRHHHSRIRSGKLSVTMQIGIILAALATVALVLFVLLYFLGAPA